MREELTGQVFYSDLVHLCSLGSGPVHSLRLKLLEDLQWVKMDLTVRLFNINVKIRHMHPKCSPLSTPLKPGV